MMTVKEQKRGDFLPVSPLEDEKGLREEETQTPGSAAGCPVPF